MGRKKGKHVAHNKNPDMQKHGETSRNSKPAKATFGEFFEFTNKARLEEIMVPQATTLDSQTHTVVCMEKASPRRDGQVGTQQPSGEVRGHGEQEKDGSKACDTLMVELEVDMQETQVWRRPLNIFTAESGTIGMLIFFSQLCMGTHPLPYETYFGSNCRKFKWGIHSCESCWGFQCHCTKLRASKRLFQKDRS